ncbi:manganese catalase family protein [Parapedobacter sp. GCM10030251]|jgi:Mn-containing catalase|uniref:manganese catalase family protein n=1 Tax=Parapedobacter sp. GCM10030251 TaxID=3273419 RepID=UPI0036161C58
MFYHEKKLQYTVRVEKPDPQFARLLQQAIGGIEGEMRVCLQYLFQAWGNRGPTKYRDMLMETGTEEISHIEMLCTAVALNLEGAKGDVIDKMVSENPVVEQIMGGMDPRHYLSAGLAAMATDANGVPFNGSWVVASGNLAADMYANVMAEATGRTLAARLWQSTTDPGMKDMLAFLIGRDAMHQNQWLAVLEELGGASGVLPIPNSFPQDLENQDVNYSFISTDIQRPPAPDARWASGPSIDGKGQFTFEHIQPLGEEPMLAPPIKEGYAQNEQMNKM